MYLDNHLIFAVYFASSHIFCLNHYYIRSYIYLFILSFFYFHIFIAYFNLILFIYYNSIFVIFICIFVFMYSSTCHHIATYEYIFIITWKLYVFIYVVLYFLFIVWQMTRTNKEHEVLLLFYLTISINFIFLYKLLPAAFPCWSNGSTYDVFLFYFSIR